MLRCVLSKTYALRAGPPSLAWDDYVRLVEAEWTELLGRGAPESEFQSFLERHPSMVPGGFGFGGRGHQGPLHDALFTQPTLPGLRRPTPDFMWITMDSGQLLAVLIEIEAPSKLWFTAKGQETANLTQATGQLAQWKAWFKQPDNVNQFKRLYRIPDGYLSRIFDISFERHYVLVYGRRSELRGKPEANRQCRSMLPPDVERMTYDRLAPDPWLRDCLCVRVRGERFEAVSVPPTFRIGPNNAKDLAGIEGKREATLASPYLSDERKQFLIERYPYWDQWAADGAKGVRSMGDWE
jgi:hypothetical protein